MARPTGRREAICGRKRDKKSTIWRWRQASTALLGLTNTQTNAMHIQEVSTHIHAHHRPVDLQAGSGESQRGLITANVAAKEKKNVYRKKERSKGEGLNKGWIHFTGLCPRHLRRNLLYGKTVIQDKLMSLKFYACCLTRPSCQAPTLKSFQLVLVLRK